jgi:hypothetical protein
MGLAVEIPAEDLCAAAKPMLERVAGEIALQLTKAAQAVAEDRRCGCMNKEEAGAYLGQKVRTIENWMRPVGEGGRGLPHIKIGETVLFKRSRIDAWLMTLERNTPPILRPLDDPA